MRLFAAAIALALSGSAFAAEYRALGDRPAVLYDAPSSRADRLFVASRYHPFEVLVKLDLWTKVRDANGITLWTRDPHRLEQVARTRQSAYLPGVPIPDAVGLQPDAMRAIADGELVIAATSTAGMLPTLERLATASREHALLWGCKGFDPQSGRLPHELVQQSLPGCKRAGVLSGPSFALEVARGLPAALTVASLDHDFAASTAAA